MESHNHPSFIEPYQGAATGVGGILRDVFTMGARPIAAMNALRFGEPSHPRTRHLVSGVVHDLCLGKGFEFIPCGSINLGDETIRLYDAKAAPVEGLLRPRPHPDGLTEREVEVLRLLAAGKRISASPMNWSSASTRLHATSPTSWTRRLPPTAPKPPDTPTASASPNHL
jgi:hypothetical protein